LIWPFAIAKRTEISLAFSFIFSLNSTPKGLAWAFYHDWSFGVTQWVLAGIAHANWAHSIQKVRACHASQILSSRLIARATGYSAKSVSWMLERAASIFCVWLVRLNMVKTKRFCIEPRWLRSWLTMLVASSGEVIAVLAWSIATTWLPSIPSPLATKTALPVSWFGLKPNLY